MTPLRQWLFVRRDELLATALLVLGLAELLFGETYQGRHAWPGPGWAGLVQVCAFTIPLAWRRRAPLASCLTALVAIATASLLWGAAESTTAFLVLLVTVFSGVGHARRVWPVVVVAALALAVHNGRDPSVATVVDWFWSAGFLVVAVLLGVAARTRQLRILTLQRDAETMSQTYDARVAAATAAERAAIARELHDIVAHAVSVIVIQAQAGSRAVEDDERSTALGLLSTIESTGRSAMDDLRRLLRLLSADDAQVDPSPGLGHLDSLVDGFRSVGLEVDLVLPAPVPQLSSAADLAAYRLVQEALTNTLRHAAGAHARVEVAVCGPVVEVCVQDDGARSAPATSDGTGRGLIGMRERVTMAGGRLLESAPTGRGFRVRAELPLPDVDRELLEPAP